MPEKIARFLNHKGFAIFAIIVMAYILGAQSDKYFKWTNPPTEKKHNISSDGSGYYAYLPQVFIYGTKHFEFADPIHRKYPEAKFFEGISPYENGKSNKYFAGTAICISPFFWSAHQLTRLAGGDADGYSRSYELSVLIAAIAFWLLGALSLLALLRSYGIGRFAILFGIAGLTFATNLNYYIVYEPSFSHAYTYGLVCFLMLQSKRYADDRRSGHLLWIFFLLGLITIIRPTNLIVAMLIPLFFTSFQAFFTALKDLLQHRKPVMLGGIVIFGALILVQFLNIRSQFGYWGFNAYSTEGFDFLFSPKIGEVLFGFRKGFFVYTPFMLLIFPALYFLYRRNSYFFYGLLVFTTLFVYIMASWWCWYYGGSLGMRPLIDIYGVLIVPVVLMFARVNLLLKGILLVFTGFMIHFNMVLNYQLQHAILHYSEMNKERFATVFMQTGGRFEWIFHMTQPDFDRSQYTAFRTFGYDPLAGKWTMAPTKDTRPDQIVPSLIFRPDSALYASDIALGVRYEIRIGNEEFIPKVLLFGYKDQQREELSVNFTGIQVPRIDLYCPAEALLHSSKIYSDFDSLEVIIENGEGKGEVRRPSCTLYSRK